MVAVVVYYVVSNSVDWGAPMVDTFSALTQPHADPEDDEPSFLLSSDDSDSSSEDEGLVMKTV